MIGGCTNYLATMPEITVYMNCDTRLAINLRMFDLGDNDEFIFAIKNYNYIDSGYVYLYKARNSDIDPKTGEVVFKITPRASKRIKPGAFYNFALLANAYDKTQPTEYKKLTENGSIHIDYGAQDLLAQTTFGTEFTEDIIAARLAPLDTTIKPESDAHIGEILSGKLEET